MTPKLIHEHHDEHSVLNYPRLCYTHEQGKVRIVDRFSGIDIKIILAWLRDGTLPHDITRESLKQAVSYQSELDAAEMLIAWCTCTSAGERLGAPQLMKFRLLPKADRDLLVKLFAEQPMPLDQEHRPMPCACEAKVLITPGRGIQGWCRCTACLHEWPIGFDDRPKHEWEPSPTYADSLNEIR